MASLGDLESDIYDFLVARKWHTLKPADIAKSISIEAAELLELFQWSDETLAELKKDDAKLVKLKEELGDILICCLEMAALLEVDTEAAIKTKLAKVKAKYPATAMRRAVEEHTGSGPNPHYLRIKHEHRKQK